MVVIFSQIYLIKHLKFVVEHPCVSPRNTRISTNHGVRFQSIESFHNNWSKLDEIQADVRPSFRCIEYRFGAQHPTSQFIDSDLLKMSRDF